MSWPVADAAAQTLQSYTIDFETPATGSTLCEGNTTLMTPFGQMRWDPQGTFWINNNVGPLQGTTCSPAVDLPAGNGTILVIDDRIRTGQFTFDFSYDFFFFDFPVYAISGQLDNVQNGSRMQIEAFDVDGNYINAGTPDIAYYVTGDGDRTGFFSFASATGSIYKLQISNINADFIGIDNLVISSIATVPEPASLGLLALGLLGTGAAARRRRRSAA